MLFPPWLERFQIRYINPMLKPVARYLPGTAIIKHRGRKSGTPYETIVTAYRKGPLLAIALAHGKTNWVKNVLAAGEAEVQFLRTTVHLTNPGYYPRAPQCGAAAHGPAASTPGRDIRGRHQLSALRWARPGRDQRGHARYPEWAGRRHDS